MAETSEDWRSKCLEAQAALRNTKKRVKIQTIKSRQLVAAVKQKLEEKDVELNKVRVFHDEQLHTLCQQLILIQSATYREQAKVQELLRAKESTIAKLRNEIISLKNSNNVHPNYPAVESASNKPLHPHRSCHGSFRLYKKELRDKLSATNASTNPITALTKHMVAATTSSEESEATAASPSSVARHNPLRQTLSLPQQSNSQLTKLESVSPHHSKVPLTQTLSCGGSSVRISMNKTNNTLLENSLTPTALMDSVKHQDAKSDSGKGDSSENEATDKMTVDRHHLATPSTHPKSDSSQISCKTNCLGNLVPAINCSSSIDSTINASSDTCSPNAEPPLTSTPNRLLSGHRQISSSSSTSSSPNSSFDGNAEDSGIGMMTVSPIQSCITQQMSPGHVKQSNRVAVPSAPPPPVPPKVIRKKPMPPPRSSMTKLTTVSTTPLTRQPKPPVDRPAVDRSSEKIATVGKSAPPSLSHPRSQELCRPNDSLVTDFSKLSLPHVNSEPYKKGIDATGRLQGTPFLADTAKSSAASNHSSLSKTKDASANLSPSAATGASFSRKTGLLNLSEVAEANHVALAARNSSEKGGAPQSDVQPKKSILHTTSPSDASKALDNLIHNNNKKGVTMSDNKSSTLKKKVKFHPELESSSSSSSSAAGEKTSNGVGGQARRPKESGSDPLDALLSQYSPKIVSRIGKGGENQDKISYFEPFI